MPVVVQGVAAEKPKQSDGLHTLEFLFVDVLVITALFLGVHY